MIGELWRLDRLGSEIVDIPDLKSPITSRQSTLLVLRARAEVERLERRGDGAALHFSLPAGSYATVLVAELFD